MGKRRRISILLLSLALFISGMPLSAFAESAETTTSKYTPKKTSVSKCTPSKKSCKIKWKKCSVKCTGYQVRYSTNKNFSSAKKKTVKGRKNTSCKLTGLKAGTTYYYQVRCCRKVRKKTYCSAWSSCKSFTTRAPFGTAEYKTYNCIKKGNYIYCGLKNKLVRVNLKNGKVRTIAKGHSEFFEVSDMCAKNGYIYFLCHDGEDRTCGSLYRVKFNGKNKKLLYAGDSGQNNDRFLQYVIKNNKIYYLVEADSGKHQSYAPWAEFSMYLDGSGKRLDAYLESTEYWTANRNVYRNYNKYHKQCNVKGYKVYEKSDQSNEHLKITTWLKTPEGKKIKVGSYKLW